MKIITKKKPVLRTKFDIYVCKYYHRVDTSAGGLLVPESIIRPEVSASALAWFIRFFFLNCKFLKPRGDIKNGQFGDTGNIGYNRHRTKTNKIKHNTIQQTKKMRNTNPIKNRMSLFSSWICMIYLPLGVKSTTINLETYEVMHLCQLVASRIKMLTNSDCLTAVITSVIRLLLNVTSQFHINKLLV
jgi:hypothetical protein